MKKLKFAICGFTCAMAAVFSLKLETSMAQEEYINGVLVTPEDYEDPEYLIYKNGNATDNEYEEDAYFESDNDDYNDNDNDNDTYTLDDYQYSFTPDMYEAIPYASSSKSMLNSKTYIHNSKFDGYEILEGIDISKWQGDINWAKVKASGIDFVIIRAAYRSSSSGKLATDSKFLSNIKGARNAGIEHIGIYVFSQAATVAEGKEEAEYAVNLLKDYEIDMPIVMDVEYVDSKSGHFNSSISKATKTKICEAFCDTVINRGYDAMIYSSKSFLENDPDGLYGETLSEKYGIWVAQWASKNTYSYDYQMWQFSGDKGGGKVSGISGTIDCDYWYYKEPVSDEDQEEEINIQLSDEKLAVFAGEYKILKATVKETGEAINVKWQSENPSIAYVTSSGKVVTVSRGTTNIVAITDNGQEAKCVVKVFDKISDFNIGGVTNSRYTGKAITKKVTLTSKNTVPYKGVVTSDVITIRKGPYSSFKAVKTLAKDDTFTILKQITVQNKIWYAVTYKDESGMEYEGYVYCGKEGTEYATISKKYLKLVENEDFTVSYSKNKMPGIATITINPVSAARYAGNLNTTFVIYPDRVSNVKILKRGYVSQLIGWDKVIYASGYYIYRAEAIDGTYKKIAYVSGSKPQEFKDTGLEKGKCYYYKVQAVKRVDGNVYTGYMSTAKSTRTSNTSYKTAKVVKDTYIFRYAGTSYDKVIKITSGTKINVVYATSKDAKGNLWYYVKYTTGGKNYLGYVRATYVNFTMKGKVICDSLNVRSGPGKSYTILACVSKGKIFNISDEVNDWYKVAISVKGVSKVGYVKKTYIQIIN